MTIPAISAMPSIAPVAGTAALRTPAVAEVGGDGFSASMTNAVDSLQQLQATSDTLAVTAVTGDLSDIHTATIAATRAQVTLELVAAVRNKGVDAFNEIMRMQG